MITLKLVIKHMIEKLQEPNKLESKQKGTGGHLAMRTGLRAGDAAEDISIVPFPPIDTGS